MLSQGSEPHTALSENPHWGGICRNPPCAHRRPEKSEFPEAAGEQTREDIQTGESEHPLEQWVKLGLEASLIRCRRNAEPPLTSLVQQNHNYR